jgi:hypothetical protein
MQSTSLKSFQNQLITLYNPLTWSEDNQCGMMYIQQGETKYQVKVLNVKRERIENFKSGNEIIIQENIFRILTKKGLFRQSQHKEIKINKTRVKIDNEKLKHVTDDQHTNTLQEYLDIAKCLNGKVEKKSSPIEKETKRKTTYRKAQSSVSKRESSTTKTNFNPSILKQHLQQELVHSDDQTSIQDLKEKKQLLREKNSLEFIEISQSKENQQQISLIQAEKTKLENEINNLKKQILNKNDLLNRIQELYAEGTKKEKQISEDIDKIDKLERQLKELASQLNTLPITHAKERELEQKKIEELERENQELLRQQSITKQITEKNIQALKDQLFQTQADSVISEKSNRNFHSKEKDKKSTEQEEKLQELLESLEINQRRNKAFQQKVQRLEKEKSAQDLVLKKQEEINEELQSSLKFLKSNHGRELPQNKKEKEEIERLTHLKVSLEQKVTLLNGEVQKLQSENQQLSSLSEDFPISLVESALEFSVQEIYKDINALSLEIKEAQKLEDKDLENKLNGIKEEFQEIVKCPEQVLSSPIVELESKNSLLPLYNELQRRHRAIKIKLDNECSKEISLNN